MNEAIAIRCDHVSVEFASGSRFAGRTNVVQAIDDVSVGFAKSKISALIGPSGCGKTTLLRLLAGLQSPTFGTIDLGGLSSRGGEVAFVFQQPSLLPWRTALENVSLPLKLLGRGNSKDRRDRATELLKSVELDDVAKRLPSQLSGGMKMRVSLARALVTEPSVLLLDEPFAALDDMLRSQLGELLLDLWRERSFTTVLVTHNIAEACLLAHQIHVINRGKIVNSIDNPLPWPRHESLRREARFGEFYGTLSDVLKNSDGCV
ncbi:Aliphatic sulfonates import ATP-binding protein SsuB [Novipirellula aureliae]|uniref:Aliphatic sulfonates import ATP-binding protein SsuB n=2 Tax=Novipirellula aureliae TaxID=2527966 RepID=A0A5C6E3T2_9BACT|nr:Aliphatic sulfonates import ATP-binding protein SsuB [Novipirellula aureliae]